MVRSILTALSIFQSTLPRGERRSSSCSRSKRAYFNPRSREGSDLKGSLLSCNQIISIHAPARGATRDMLRPADILHISIHAPARGATARIVHNYFVKSISIHAPARGATVLFDKVEHVVRNFNPRSREGSDVQVKKLFSRFLISIHAPARGATVSSATHPLTGVFQSTLPRGERRIQTVAHICALPISIHAPARGATCPTSAFAIAPAEFQSTLPRGERRHNLFFRGIIAVFQSTLPRGERPIFVSS